MAAQTSGALLERLDALLAAAAARQRAGATVLVAVEQFRLNPSIAPSRGWDTIVEVEHIGMARLRCRDLGLACVLIPPSAHKPLWTSRRLRAMGLWVRGEHARDALRVACEAARRQGWLVPCPLEPPLA